MASSGSIEDLMSILDVDEERAKELVAKHGSVEEAIKHGDDAAADDDEGDAPDLAAAGAGDAAPAAVAGAGGMTSAERKARKAFESIGLKEQPGFKRIIINYGRQAAIEIASPSVHRLPATDYWVIFGNAIPVDLSRTSEAAKQFSLGGASPSGPGAVPPAVAEALTAAGEADAAEAAAASAGAATSAAAPAAAASGTGAEDEVDLSRLPKGIVEKDVDFVAEHAGVTRAQAVEALIEHKQVVPAAMSFGEAAE